MTDPGSSLSSFDFSSGALRGSHLTLHPTSLVHRGGAQLETLPLATLASVRVAFERDPGRMRWGVALLVVALLLLVSSGPLGSFAASAAGEIAGAGAQGVARALQSLFRLLELFARILPVIALVTAAGGAGLAALGWIGGTTLTVSFAGFERNFSVRGRNTQLLDFSEALAAQLMSLRR